MLCEDCKQKPATIHYTQVIGGVSREIVSASYSVS